MGWFYIILAGLFEITWAVSLKFNSGFTRLWPSVGTCIAMLASLYFLNLGIQSLPIGTAYAVWTGIGSVGTAIIGIVIFGESGDYLRLFCMFLILAGIFGLKLTSSS